MSRCGICKGQKELIEFLVTDAGQFFEIASPKTVNDSLEMLTEVAKWKGYKAVRLKKSTKVLGYLVKHVVERDKRWLNTSLEDVMNSFVMGLKQRFASSGNAIYYQAKGIPIGGMLSPASVHVVMSLTEWVWDLEGIREQVEEDVRNMLKLNEKGDKNSNKFLNLKCGSTKGIRYADDLLQCSKNLGKRRLKKDLITFTLQRTVGKNKKKKSNSANMMEKCKNGGPLSGWT